MIRLRALEPEDLDVLYQVENDYRLWNVGVTNVPYSRYALHNYIVLQTGDIYTDRQVRLMMENEEGEAVGIVDVVNFDPQHLRAELGVVVMEKYRRRGYAGEALREVIRYSVETLHLHQLYTFVDKANEASLSLFLKMGFEKVACLRDWLFDGRQYHDTLFLQLFCEKVQ